MQQLAKRVGFATVASLPPGAGKWPETRGRTVRRPLLDGTAHGPGHRVGRLAGKKWRQPLILCYLEGRTQDEAAAQLHWSKSTIRRRLEEARAALGPPARPPWSRRSAAYCGPLLSDCCLPHCLRNLTKRHRGRRRPDCGGAKHGGPCIDQRFCNYRRDGSRHVS